MIIIWQQTPECIKKSHCSDRQVTGLPNSQNQPPKATSDRSPDSLESSCREETRKSCGVFSSELTHAYLLFTQKEQGVCSLPLALHSNAMLANAE